MLRFFKGFTLLFFLTSILYAEESKVRGLLELIMTSSGNEQKESLVELSNYSDPQIKTIVEAWRKGDVYSFTKNGESIVVQQTNSGFERIKDGELLIIEDQSSLKKNRPSRRIRKSLKKIVDTADLIALDPKVRKEAVLKLGLSQNLSYLDDLRRIFKNELDPSVQKVFRESIAICLLAHGSDQEKLSAIEELGILKSVTAIDFIEKIVKNAPESLSDISLEPLLKDKAEMAILKIKNHQSILDFFGNLFRGFSLGSVLLIVSFGLAITFGLMGIINMAHGEFIAIGGYSCYVVQNLFASWFGTHSVGFELYFLAAIPVSFVVACLFGFLLEKSFIRFLYKRPLESLLATWGVSMIMQQSFRLVFGAANVQVNTPDWLIKSADFYGVAMSYSRIFVVGFALMVILMTWLLLSKTHLGLHIRAVMQNRKMASSLGIPVSKVNAMTFAFGCGLASLAGCALSLIGNVGPSMGQAYLVDSFMVVVIGSVGNLLGAGISSFGIGIFDQYLQPVLGPVMGKITVFFIIILFLQWKPGGLFPTKSRSLED